MPEAQAKTTDRLSIVKIEIGYSKVGPNPLKIITT